MNSSKKYSLQVFEGETKISTTSFPQNFTIATEHFLPLPDENVVFYFEASHTSTQIFKPHLSGVEQTGFGFGFVPATEYPKYEFLLKLIWQSNAKLNPSRSMKVEVKVCYSDGSLFYEYAPLSNIKIDQMTSVVFDIVTHSTNVSTNVFGSNVVGHSNFTITDKNYTTKIERGPLTLMCKLSFNSDIPPLLFSSSNFTNNLKAVYESSLFNDLVINVGDKSFPVHKVILAAHSSVFAKMLTQDCLEAKENRVTISDSTPEIFDLFLRFLYSGEIVNRSWSSVKDLYGLADKYDVEILRKDCIDIFVSLMSVDLICEILKIAYTYDDSGLKTAAKSFAVKNIKQLISRDDWKHLVAMHPIIGYEVIVNFVPT